MKSFKRVLALLLAVVMVFGLAGCGKFETKMVKVAKAMAKLQSFRSDFDVEMTVGMPVMGMPVNMDMTITGDGAFRRGPFQGKVNLKLDAMDEDLDLECYFEREKKSLVSYISSDGGKTWVSRVTPMDELPEKSTVKEKISNLSPETLVWLAKASSTFKEKGTETVRGSEATVYSGVIKGEMLQESLDKAMAQADDSSPIDLSELDLTDVGDIPVTLWIDSRNDMIVKISADLSGIMKVFMPYVIKAATKAAEEEGGLGSLGLSMFASALTISRMEVSAEFYDFDKVEEIQAPDKALVKAA